MFYLLKCALTFDVCICRLAWVFSNHATFVGSLFMPDDKSIEVELESFSDVQIPFSDVQICTVFAHRSHVSPVTRSPFTSATSWAHRRAASARHRGVNRSVWLRIRRPRDGTLPGDLFLELAILIDIFFAVSFEPYRGVVTERKETPEVVGEILGSWGCCSVPPSFFHFLVEVDMHIHIHMMVDGYVLRVHICIFAVTWLQFTNTCRTQRIYTPTCHMTHPGCIFFSQFFMIQWGDKESASSKWCSQMAASFNNRVKYEHLEYQLVQYLFLFQENTWVTLG